MRRRALGFGKKVVERIMVISALRIAILLCGTCPLISSISGSLLSTAAERPTNMHSDCSVADSQLTFYSLPDFQPLPPQMFPPIKGVTAFCEDSAQSGHVSEDGSVRLCVIKRRLIQFYNVWPDAISDPKVFLQRTVTTNSAEHVKNKSDQFYLHSHSFAFDIQ